MTKEEILAMVPGPELDRLVAEKVMGWTIYHYDKDVPERCYYMLVNEDFDSVAPFEGWHTGERKTEEEAWKDNKPFSTDITAAWGVAEKMPTPFVILKSYQDQFGVGPIGWLVNWCDNDGECGCIYGETCINDKTVWALTAPEAICKAALLAVMEL